MLYIASTFVSALLLPAAVMPGQQRSSVVKMSVEASKDAAFGASHTSFYTDAVKQDNYLTLEEARR